MTVVRRGLVAAALILWSSLSWGQVTKPLVYAMYADIKDWDPAVAASTEIILLHNVYETLLRYDPGAGKPGPALAVSWSSSKDGREWKFVLRKGVRFHDGTPFDAAAAKASLERTIKLGKGASYIWDAVESIAAPNPTTLFIRTKTPAPIDLIAAAQYAAYMVSPKAMAAGTDWFNAGNAAGTGPYRVKSWNRGQSVVLERFDDYWGGWKPRQIGSVHLRVVQEAATQVQLLRSGEADFVSLPAADLVKSFMRDPNIVTLRKPSWRNTQLLLNTKMAPTDNPLFRRALTHAWDYTAVVRGVYEGVASRAFGPIPATMWGHDRSLKTPDFDLDRARALLEASGVPKDQRRIGIAYVGTSEEYRNSLLLFQANLAKIGVKVDLKPGPWGKIWDDAKRPQTATHAITMTWWPTYATPSDWLVGLFRSESPTVFNLSHYSNPRYDALVNQGLAAEALDRAAAAAAYGRAQQLLLDDAVAIFVADLDAQVFFRKGIEGVTLNPAYTAVNFYALTR